MSHLKRTLPVSSITARGDVPPSIQHRHARSTTSMAALHKQKAVARGQQRVKQYSWLYSWSWMREIQTSQPFGSGLSPAMTLQYLLFWESYHEKCFFLSDVYSGHLVKKCFSSSILSHTEQLRFSGHWSYLNILLFKGKTPRRNCVRATLKQWVVTCDKYSSSSHIHLKE